MINYSRLGYEIKRDFIILSKKALSGLKQPQKIKKERREHAKT